MERKMSEEGTKAAEEIPWDGARDLRYYHQAIVRRKITRYNICCD